MSPRPTVLVVDDDRLSRITTVQQLRGAGFHAHEADSAFRALAWLEASICDVVLSDLRMPGMDGLSFLRELRRRHPDIDVMLMTAYGSVESAVLALQDGAVDYLTKPFRFQELELRLNRLGERREHGRELQRLRALLEVGDGGLVGRSPEMRRARDRISVFADHTAPVLVTGETGTGKEVVSRLLHDRGARRGGPFVAVACGAIPRELAESSFLGHEKGSFTGAGQRRRGSFEQADGGTLLLDDVDDLPLEIQVKLLRVLQEGTFTRVGGSEEISVDVRVVATTKEDLASAVADGRFRSDLYYRLRGLELRLPPLRARGDDLILLAGYFLRALAAAEERSPATLSPEAIAALRAHSWPGNVRELRRTLEAGDVLARGLEIRPEHLSEQLGTSAVCPAPYSLRLGEAERVDLEGLLVSFEQEILAWALERAGGRQTKAAEILGIPRTTLQSKLNRG